jgi:hypothetical protein
MNSVADLKNKLYSLEIIALWDISQRTVVIPYPRFGTTLEDLTIRLSRKVGKE